MLSPKVFTRISRSLVSGAGAEAPEAYTIWDGDEELAPDNILTIPSPLALPWDDRKIQRGLMLRFERAFINDEIVHKRITDIVNRLKDELTRLTMQSYGNYAFANDVELAHMFKAFDFRPAIGNNDLMFLDNIVSFLGAFVDSSSYRILAFMNLKNFLTNEDIDSLYHEILSLEIPVMLIESTHDSHSHSNEQKIVIDQHFL